MAFFVLVAFVILTNHSWNGDPAAFKIRTVTAVIAATVFRLGVVFIISNEKIRIADGMD